MVQLVDKYKGFDIKIGMIRDGHRQYYGVTARKQGVRIESPEGNADLRDMCKVIDQFTNK